MAIVCQRPNAIAMETASFFVRTFLLLLIVVIMGNGTDDVEDKIYFPDEIEVRTKIGFFQSKPPTSK